MLKLTPFILESFLQEEKRKKETISGKRSVLSNQGKRTNEKAD